MASILLVDDSPDMRRVMAQILEIDGHAVTEASSGEEALQLAAGQKFELFMLDHRMPDGMTGLDAVRELRKMDGNATTPVIVLTGLDEAELREEANQLGIKGVILKGSVDVDVILAEVTKHLERKSESSN